MTEKIKNSGLSFKLLNNKKLTEESSLELLHKKHKIHFRFSDHKSIKIVCRLFSTFIINGNETGHQLQLKLGQKCKKLYVRF